MHSVRLSASTASVSLCLEAGASRIVRYSWILIRAHINVGRVEAKQTPFHDYHFSFASCRSDEDQRSTVDNMYSHEALCRALHRVSYEQWHTIRNPDTLPLRPQFIEESYVVEKRRRPMVYYIQEAHKHFTNANVSRAKIKPLVRWRRMQLTKDHGVSHSSSTTHENQQNNSRVSEIINFEPVQTSTSDNPQITSSCKQVTHQNHLNSSSTVGNPTEKTDPSPASDYFMILDTDVGQVLVKVPKSTPQSVASAPENLTSSKSGTITINSNSSSYCSPCASSTTVPSTPFPSTTSFPPITSTPVSSAPLSSTPLQPVTHCNEITSQYTAIIPKTRAKPLCRPKKNTLYQSARRSIGPPTRLTVDQMKTIYCTRDCYVRLEQLSESMIRRFCKGKKKLPTSHVSSKKEKIRKDKISPSFIFDSLATPSSTLQRDDERVVPKLKISLKSLCATRLSSKTDAVEAEGKIFYGNSSEKENFPTDNDEKKVNVIRSKRSLSPLFGTPPKKIDLSDVKAVRMEYHDKLSLPSEKKPASVMNTDEPKSKCKPSFFTTEILDVNQNYQVPTNVTARGELDLKTQKISHPFHHPSSLEVFFKNVDEWTDLICLHCRCTFSTVEKWTHHYSISNTPAMTILKCSEVIGKVQ